MTTPFLKFYQDLSKVHPPNATSDLIEVSVRESRWHFWLDERQQGSRWTRSKLRKLGDEGLRAGLEWRETWSCNHAGSYQDRRKANLSPQKKRSRKTTIKIRCPATITASKIQGSDSVLITWKHKHEGHGPASIKDWRESSLSEHIRIWVKERVAEGRDWRSIHSLLRINQKELGLLDKTSTRLPQALRLTRQDVYNILRQQLVARSRKDSDLTRSLVKWVETIVADGGWGYVMHNSVGFATEWQRSLWSATTVCLDSTHNTCQGSFYLYTIVARSKLTGRGTPAAFFLTTDAGQTPLQDFLQRLPINPNFFMIDCSFTEAGAIMGAYPRAKILYCNWHVLKAVHARAKILIHHNNATERRSLVQEAFDDFKIIMQLEDMSLYYDAYQDFSKKWNMLGQPGWVNYFSRQWNPFRQRWIKAWRLDHHDGIDTNNYIERWHGRLKTNYLSTLRRQRADYLLHLLVEKIVPDYRQEAKQVEIGVASPSYSKAERSAKEKAMHADLSLVHGDTVQSFTGSGFYKLIDGVCTCQASKPCKHMFLVQRLQPLSGHEESSCAHIENNVEAIAYEKQNLIAGIAMAIQQLCTLTHKLSDDCSRQWLADFQAKITTLKHEMSDSVCHRSPSATQR